MKELKEKAEKLIWMALDQAGNVPQMDEAAAAIFRLCRKEKVDAKAFFAMFGGTFSYGPAEKDPPSTKVRMPFGKHKGQALGDIAMNNSGYLTWILENTNPRPELKKAIEQTLEHAMS